MPHLVVNEAPFVWGEEGYQTRGKERKVNLPHGTVIAVEGVTQLQLKTLSKEQATNSSGADLPGEHDGYQPPCSQTVSPAHKAEWLSLECKIGVNPAPLFLGSIQVLSYFTTGIDVLGKVKRIIERSMRLCGV